MGVIRGCVHAKAAADMSPNRGLVQVRQRLHDLPWLELPAFPITADGNGRPEHVFMNGHGLNIHL